VSPTIGVSWKSSADSFARERLRGIVFANDKLSLAEHQWRGPGKNDEPTQGQLFG